LLRSFSGFSIVLTFKVLFWVAHQSTLCRQNVKLKRIHAVLLVAYVLFSLMKYLHSVNLAADYYTYGNWYTGHSGLIFTGHSGTWKWMYPAFYIMTHPGAAPRILRWGYKTGFASGTSEEKKFCTPHFSKCGRYKQANIS